MLIQLCWCTVSAVTWLWIHWGCWPPHTAFREGPQPDTTKLIISNSHSTNVFNICLKIPIIKPKQTGWRRLMQHLAQSQQRRVKARSGLIWLTGFTPLKVPPRVRGWELHSGCTVHCCVVVSASEGRRATASCSQNESASKSRQMSLCFFFCFFLPAEL